MNKLLAKLNDIADLIEDSGFIDVKRMFSEDFGNVHFYVDNTLDSDFMSVTFEGINVAFYRNKISKIEIDEPEQYGRDLEEWAREAMLEVIEGIAEKVEQKHEDIEEAKATGN